MGCVGRPMGDDGGTGCDSVAQVVFGSRARVTGSAAPAAPDLVARVASGSSAHVAAAVLAEAVRVVAMALRRQGR
jgi:hypothetical protein